MAHEMQVRWKLRVLGVAVFTLLMLLVFRSQTSDNNLGSARQTLLARQEVHLSRTAEEEKALAFNWLRHTAATIKSLEASAPPCKTTNFGTDKVLCDFPPAPPCYFHSYGIFHDFSFDSEMADRWKCFGVGLDPTVTHKSQLHQNVHFIQAGAKMLLPEENNAWPMSTSMPSLRKWLGHTRITVLKVDCEGCEYAIARDVLLEDPFFFDHVDQFTIEIHVGRAWIKTEEHAVQLGLLFYLLSESGLQLVHAKFVSCAPDWEAKGCPDELLRNGYPCESKKMCQMLSFARL
eukprot:GILK01002496.1.p1 GENE.GILK01002496.1~~GILK01002496.1.p1  ORF type:complete len:306 (-),score=22.26 GILK01002496.1:71-940(-)